MVNKKQIGVVAAGVLLCAHVALAQQPSRSKPYTPPKTPWGEPDLRGMWPLSHLVGTPFERPEQFGERRLMTDEEFAAAQKRAKQFNDDIEAGTRNSIPQFDDR